MSDLLNLHNEAMDLALLGDKELELGNKKNACDYYFQAFVKEKEEFRVPRFAMRKTPRG